MPDSKTNPVKAADSVKLSEAVRHLQAKQYTEAKTLLLGIVENTPADYCTEYEMDGAITVLLWDLAAFGNYTRWKKSAKTIQWIAAIYPPAFYYLGYISIEERNLAKAIELLDRGAALEPENPRFKLEMAQAHLGLRQFGEAISQFNQITKAGPFVSESDVSAALRGKGFVFIEIGRLDKAEEALRESLRLEPNNERALHELKYIAQLQAKSMGRGGATNSTSVGSDGQSGKRAWEFWKR